MNDEWIQKQLEQFQFEFDKADKDKSGNLSFPEVRAVFESQGFVCTDEQAKGIFKDLDKDGNKSISRDEFSGAINSLPTIAKRELCLRKMFKALDKDRSGFLSRREIINGTSERLVGMDIPQEQITKMLLALCKDEDGQLDYEEFLRIFRIESEANHMRKIFTKLDADGNGYLTKDEVYKAVNYDSELKLPMDKVAELAIYVVKDDDQKISYEEFINVWLKQKDQPKK